MKELLRIEVRKSLKNRLFLIVVVIGIGLSIYSALENFRHYQTYWEMFSMAERTTGLKYNPNASIVTLFNTWIGEDFSSVATSLFYLLLPILATLPFGMSFVMELDSGYSRHIYTRTKRIHYLLAKYVSTFISGALAIGIPMLINLLLVSSIVPAIKPSYFNDIYYAMSPGSMGAELFYLKPFIFIGVRFLLSMTFGGLCAVSCIAISFFSRNRFAVILAPFLSLLTVHYFSGLIAFYWNGYELSPLNFIHGGNLNTPTLGIVLVWIAIVFFLSFGVTMWKGLKSDVF